MSAAAVEPSPERAGIDCDACELAFAPMSSRGEAQFLADTHNRMVHGGRLDAVVCDSPVPVLSVIEQLGWRVDEGVLAEAQEHARPFVGDESAVDRAWSARADAAVQGMDVVDSAGVDAWMGAHATSSSPHLAEAVLVAAWETHVRDLYSEPAQRVSEAVDEDAWAL